MANKVQMRVYIAEDSKAVLDRLIFLLEGIAGVDIAGQTGSLRTARDHVLKLKPDVVLADIRLSDGNSLDVLAEMRAKGMKTTFIAMTFDPYPECRKQAKKLGAACIIDKTTDLWKIPAMFEEMIAAQQAV